MSQEETEKHFPLAICGERKKTQAKYLFFAIFIPVQSSFMCRESIHAY